MAKGNQRMSFTYFWVHCTNLVSRKYFRPLQHYYSFSFICTVITHFCYTKLKFKPKWNMIINWFQTYIYEHMFFIFHLLLRCLQFFSVFRLRTSPTADFAEVFVLSLDFMRYVYMCVSRSLRRLAITPQQQHAYLYVPCHEVPFK
jgi:hypothetical protein